MSEKIKYYPGTELESADLKSKKIITIKWRPNAKYAWTAGIAMSRYLDELKNGRLIGRRCNQCKRVLVPPRMFCEQCFRPTDDWVYTKDTGTINTFSIPYIDADVNRVTTPTPVAVIEIDGASPGVGILHRLGNVDPKQIKVGMRVRAVWKSQKDREGSVNDILFWEPIKER